MLVEDAGVAVVIEKTTEELEEVEPAYVTITIVDVLVDDEEVVGVTLDNEDEEVVEVLEEDDRDDVVKLEDDEDDDEEDEEEGEDDVNDIDSIEDNEEVGV